MGGHHKRVLFLNFAGFWILGVPIGALLAFVGDIGVRGLWWGMSIGIYASSIVGILSRYMPDSMLRERSLKTDTQVIAAIKLVSNDMQYNKLLGRTNQNPLPESVHTTLALRKDNLSGAGASIVVDSEDDSAVKLNLKF